MESCGHAGAPLPSGRSGNGFDHASQIQPALNVRQDRRFGRGHYDGMVGCQPRKDVVSLIPQLQKVSTACGMHAQCVHLNSSHLGPLVSILQVSAAAEPTLG